MSLIELILKNCTFYCKKNKRTTYTLVIKKSLPSTFDIPIESRLYPCASPTFTPYCLSGKLAGDIFFCFVGFLLFSPHTGPGAPCLLSPASGREPEVLVSPHLSITVLMGSFLQEDTGAGFPHWAARPL